MAEGAVGLEQRTAAPLACVPAESQPLRVLADELAVHGLAGLRSYEQARRAETADVIAANREMHVAGASQTSAELASVAARYRTDTAKSTRS